MVINNLFYRYSRRLRGSRRNDFLEIMQPKNKDIFLDVGGELVDGDKARLEDYINFLKKIRSTKILVNINKEKLSREIDGLSVIRVCADASCIPFKDGSIDVLYSNAVLEHVGGSDRQESYAKEVMRVSDYWYVSTPNNSFPFEMHYRLPLIHWAPVKIRELVFRLFGMVPMDISLISSKKMRKLFPNASYHIQRFAFLPAILIAHSSKKR